MDKAFSIEDALVYLDKIKCAYAHQPEVYGKFLSMMKDYKKQIIKTDQVIQKVSALFAENEHLIMEFTNFLPCETDASLHSISAEVQHAPTKMQQAHAMQFVIKVRNRFIHYPLVYSRFLDILQVYHSNRNSIGEVLEHVAQLFADQEDLLTEFVFFLPEVLQDQAKTRMDVVLRECKSRRQQREQQEQEQEKYHYPLPVPVEQPCSSSVTQQPINTSLPELTSQRPSEVSVTAHSVVSTLPPALSVSAPVPSVKNNNTLPRTSVPLSISSDSVSHRSSSSLSTSSGMSSAGFEVIPQEEACAAATVTETDKTHSMHSAEQLAQPAQPTPRTTRSTATCFHSPTIVEAHSSTPAVGAKRKKRATEDAPGVTYNTRGSSKQQKTAAVSPVNISDEQSAQLHVQQLWARNVQMSAAMADLDRRLGTVECLVDLQRKRVEDHKAEIAALKKRLNGKNNEKD
eukprot:gene20868-23697_t